MDTEVISGGGGEDTVTEQRAWTVLLLVEVAQTVAVLPTSTVEGTEISTVFPLGASRAV